MHIPVLLDRVIETLGDVRGQTIVDATFGAGGYTKAFMERGANVIAFDRDPSVALIVDEIKKQYGDKFKFINAPFSQISILDSRFSHIVFDFGVSSMQIDTPERGFSFRFDAALDMRMQQSAHSPQPTAAELIESTPLEQLVKILREYGDVKKSGPIARAMKNAMPKTTFQLRDLIYDPRDIANVFQALRIAVNDELGEIERALSAVPDLLSSGGKCVCVTFHSLEDRIVKKKFRELTTPLGDPRLPSPLGDFAATIPTSGARQGLCATPLAIDGNRDALCATPLAGGLCEAVGGCQFKLLKTYRPDETELNHNPRARSSHLRAVIKI